MVTVTFVNADGTESVIAEQGRDGYEINACESTTGLDIVSSATIGIPATNKMRNVLRGRSATIAIYEDMTRVFIGSVSSPIVEDALGNVKVSLDGALSWLGDITKPPFKVSAASGKTVATYMGNLVDQYNAGARAERQIKLGGVTVDGVVEVMHSTEYKTMLDLIREIREMHGGYLLEVMGGRGDLPRIDYIAQPTIKNPHPLYFGENLKSLEDVLSFDGYASRVCASTNDGLTYVATDTTAEQLWGRVDRAYSSQAESSAELQADANAVLASAKNPIQKVTAEAVDAKAHYLPSQLVDIIDRKTGVRVELTVLEVRANHMTGERSITCGTERPADFSGSVAGIEKRNEQKTQELSEKSDWRWIQDRIRHENVSTIPLDFVSGVTDIVKSASSTPWAYNSYRPRVLFSWARKSMSIEANFVMRTTVSTSGTTLLTGLPTIFSSVRLYNALMYVDSDGQLRTCNARYTTEGFSQIADANHFPASASEGDCVYLKDCGEYYTYMSGSWVRRYTPKGVLQFFRNDWENATKAVLPSGKFVHVDSQSFTVGTKYGGVVFPRITKTDIQRVSTWIKNHRGKYDYSNNGIWRRKLAEEQSGGLGATDCSGIIHQAFRYGAGKFVPDGTKVMIGYGKVVTFARAGEQLDTSKLREGDIVGWINAKTEGRVFSMHHVAIAVKGKAEDPNDNVLRLWHQTTSFGCYTQKAQPGWTKADDVIPEYQPYIHDSVVSALSNVQKPIVYGPQPCAGTYRATGNTYSDANYRDWEARIVVRWTADSDVLRVADVVEPDEDDTGGEDETA